MGRHVIREMTGADEAQIIAMMREFYTSPAVWSNGSEEIFAADYAACISDNPYLEGYVLEEENELKGYAMVAKSFSTEFGRPCIWVEDLYLKKQARGDGFGGEFLEFLAKKYENAILRLEVEEENERAIRVYEAHGFSMLPYQEMKRDSLK